MMSHFNRNKAGLIVPGLANLILIKGEKMMGYCSKVAVVISKPAYNEFLKHLAAKVLERDDNARFNPFSLLDDADVKRETDNAVLFCWNWVKWYTETDDEIAAIMDALRHLNEEDYRYVRIGEELGDFEDEGYFEGPPYISITCDINIDY